MSVVFLKKVCAVCAQCHTSPPGLVPAYAVSDCFDVVCTELLADKLGSYWELISLLSPSNLLSPPKAVSQPRVAHLTLTFPPRLTPRDPH